MIDWHLVDQITKVTCGSSLWHLHTNTWVQWANPGLAPFFSITFGWLYPSFPVQSQRGLWEETSQHQDPTTQSELLILAWCRGGAAIITHLLSVFPSLFLSLCKYQPQQRHSAVDRHRRRRVVFEASNFAITRMFSDCWDLHVKNRISPPAPTFLQQGTPQ